MALTAPVRAEILDYGVRVLRSRHLGIRELKRLHSPAYQGFRVWASSWLLMDFFKHRGLHHGVRILDVGCGWGLAGIYCAKNHGATVTAVDIDSEVFPYLHLHEEINKVEIATMQKGFDGLRAKHVKNFDIVIGADICFWDSMVDSLKRFIYRALKTTVCMVLIADPGRTPFEELGEHFVEKRIGRILEWAVSHPYPIQGRILKIGSLTL